MIHSFVSLLFAGVIMVRNINLDADSKQLCSIIGKKKTYLIFKRIFDAAVSAIVLIVIFPVLIFVSIAILSDSRGSVFYTQKRVGLNGRIFKIYKFRTMYRNSADDIVTLRKNGHIQLIIEKPQNDPRITRIGKILRKTSIDELPQLFNVLIGDMSLVGPRPLMPYLFNGFENLLPIRMIVKPGITGLWQIRQRNVYGLMSMYPHDVEYINTCSFSEDIKILLRTIPVVLSGFGAR